MVYDTESQPVNGCAVALDGAESSVTTEVNGRFFLDFVTFGKHHISLTKDGYERFEADIEFTSRTQVAHIRMFSYSSLLSDVERAMERREWDRARVALDRAASVNDNDPLAAYLGAVVDYRTGAYDDSLAVLEGLLSQGYREPFVFLFLADIYQYHVLDQKKAEQCLTSFIEIREDGAARKRLEDLRASKPN